MTNKQILMTGVLVGVLVGYPFRLAKREAVGGRMPLPAVMSRAEDRATEDGLKLWIAVEREPPLLREVPGRPACLRAFISNRGSKAATLMMPGFGSTDGLFTPFADWSVLPAEDRDVVHTPPPTEAWSQACGVYGSIPRERFFTLEPGETKEVGVHRVTGPGHYRVIFFYRHEPEAMSDFILSFFRSEAYQALKRSTRCTLVSNELLVTVPSEETLRSQEGAYWAEVHRRRQQVEKQEHNLER